MKNVNLVFIVSHALVDKTPIIVRINMIVHVYHYLSLSNSITFSHSNSYHFVFHHSFTELLLSIRHTTNSITLSHNNSYHFVTQQFLSLCHTGPRGAMIFYRKGIRSVNKKGETVMYDLESKINFSGKISFYNIFNLISLFFWEKHHWEKHLLHFSCDS